MLVPLISVSTFAETSPYFSYDFEDKTVGSSAITDSVVTPKPDSGVTYADFDGNKVIKVEVTSGLCSDNKRIGFGDFSEFYDASPDKFSITADYYFVNDTSKYVTNITWISEYINACSFNWHNDTFVVGSNSVAIERDTWYRVTALVTVAGSGSNLDIYLNGTKVGTHNFDSWYFQADQYPNAWGVAKVAEYYNSDGTFYIDNVALKEGHVTPDAPVTPEPPSPYFNYDFSDANVGEVPIIPVTDAPTAGVTYATVGADMAVKLVMSSDTNGKKVGFGDSWATLEGGDKFVLSTNYYFESGSQAVLYGAISWQSLYYFNTWNNKFYCFGETNDEGISFASNAWQNVTVVVTPSGDNTPLDIYFNGVFVKTMTITDDFFRNDNIWAPAKVEYDASGTVGNVYIDDVICETYNAKIAAEETNFDTVVSYTFAGEKTVNTSLTGEQKTYGVTDIVTADAYFAENVLINTLDIASIRLTAPTGLRFATKVDAKVLAAIEALGMKVTEMGTLIAPETYDTLDLENFVAYEDGKEVTEKTILKVVAGEYNTALGFDTDDTTHHFVGSIVDIQEYTRVFSGRGYMTVTLPNGNSYNVYSAYTKSISVKDQAQATLDADTEKTLYPVGTDNYNILAGFAGIQQ